MSKTTFATYNDPNYTSRNSEAMGEAGGGATTQYAKFCAFTASIAYAAQMTVTVAGTAAGHLFSVLKITSTTTSTLATGTLGTGAAGTTKNVELSTTGGGVPLLQGDILSVVTGADATGKAAIVYETSLAPLAPVTV